MLSFVLKSLVVMHHFRAVWMISLCHMLIQKKIIIISSVTEVLHINFIQCQLILMTHLSSFFLGFIVLQTQLAFTIGSRNKQAILDSYQSEIFFYTMNPLMIKPREYKLSWPSLYSQDDWILASFFFYFFMDRVHKNVKKRTRPIFCHFDLTLGQ